MESRSNFDLLREIQTIIIQYIFELWNGAGFQAKRSIRRCNSILFH